MLYKKINNLLEEILMRRRSKGTKWISVQYGLDKFCATNFPSFLDYLVFEVRNNSKHLFCTKKSAFNIKNVEADKGQNFKNYELRT